MKNDKQTNSVCIVHGLLFQRETFKLISWLLSSLNLIWKFRTSACSMYVTRCSCSCSCSCYLHLNPSLFLYFSLCFHIPHTVALLLFFFCSVLLCVNALMHAPIAFEKMKITHDRMMRNLSNSSKSDHFFGLVHRNVKWIEHWMNKYRKSTMRHSICISDNCIMKCLRCNHSAQFEIYFDVKLPPDSGLQLIRMGHLGVKLNHQWPNSYVWWRWKRTKRAKEKTNISKFFTFIFRRWY